MLKLNNEAYKSFKEIKEFVFPYGNSWFYVVSIMWLMAMITIINSLPYFFDLCEQYYEITLGIVVDKTYLGSAHLLFDIVLRAYRIFIIFLIASALSDYVEFNRLSRIKNGCL